MCSKDRQGLKELESKLSHAGVRFEIRGNPLTTALGITRFEIHVDDADLAAASNIWRGCLAAESEVDIPGTIGGTQGFNGFVDPAQSDLVIQTKVISSPPAAPPLDDDPDSQTETGRLKPSSDIARATAFLEEDVEALLAHELELANRCSSLEDKVKELEEALEHSRAELAREVSNRSVTEKKLTEADEARASLGKEVHALGLRLKASEQALAATKGQLESHAQQQEELMKARNEEHLQAQANVGVVNDLRDQIRARLAAREKKDSSPPERRKRRSIAEKERARVDPDGL